MANRTNLAYDFELFSEKKGKIIDLPSNKEREPKIKAIMQPKTAVGSAPAIALKTKLMIAAMVLLLGTFIFIRVQGEVKMSELTNDIDKVQSEIAELKSEKTRLDMELENLETYNNIEKKARKMGMQKQDAAQTTYVNLNEDDRALIVGQK